jgi:hypothetical protein
LSGIAQYFIIFWKYKIEKVEYYDIQMLAKKTPLCNSNLNFIRITGKSYFNFSSEAGEIPALCRNGNS